MVWFEIWQNDYDKDDLYYYEEIEMGADPTDPDTDNDGYMDGKDFDPLDKNIGNNMVINEFDPKYQYIEYGEKCEWEWGYNYAETNNSYSYISSSEKRIECGIRAFITDGDLKDEHWPIARCWHNAVMATACKIRVPSSGEVDISVVFDRIKGRGTRLMEAFSFFQIYILLYTPDGNLIWKEQVEHYNWSSIGAYDSIDWHNKKYTISVYLGKGANYSVVFLFHHFVNAQVMFAGYCTCYSYFYGDNGYIKVDNVEVKMQ